MTAHNHITAGRTAIRALLITAVVTAMIAGTVGTAAAEPLDGKGNDPYPSGLYLSLDGKGNDVYPPPVRYSLDGKGNDVYPPPVRYSLDGKGNDILIYAFPIDNVTAGGHQAIAVERLSSIPKALSAAPALVLSQDMDPY